MKMMTSRPFLTWLLLTALTTLTEGKCPSVCRCATDVGGRKLVTCDSGNLVDPIPVFEMDKETKTLQLTCPRPAFRCASPPPPPPPINIGASIPTALMISKVTQDYSRAVNSPAGDSHVQAGRGAAFYTDIRSSYLLWHYEPSLYYALVQPAPPLSLSLLLLSHLFTSPPISSSSLPPPHCPVLPTDLPLLSPPPLHPLLLPHLLLPHVPLPAPPSLSPPSFSFSSPSLPHPPHVPLPALLPSPLSAPPLLSPPRVPLLASLSLPLLPPLPLCFFHLQPPSPLSLSSPPPMCLFQLLSPSPLFHLFPPLLSSLLSACASSTSTLPPPSPSLPSPLHVPLPPSPPSLLPPSPPPSPPLLPPRPSPLSSLPRPSPLLHTTTTKKTLK
ncbi:hypothetical protein C7M84_017947 [Penaeus vannamei]|uniref:Uncharacterized protein n=1 Tax=Penaeus vannamei TaxID=6689 RepID=A0A3R7M0P9_PENVA|nr:hypothetical protein C7M84_017947 [Penaeus vannamei]